MAMTERQQYRCGCGATFPEQCGAYGCPNCHGDRGPARLTPAPPGWDASHYWPANYRPAPKEHRHDP